MNARRSAAIAFTLSVITLSALAGVASGYAAARYQSGDQGWAEHAQSIVEQGPAGAGVLAIYSGRLGSYHQVSDACSYYDLFDCYGSKIISLSEGSYGSLRAYVGSWVSVQVVTGICGYGIAGQPLYGNVVSGIEAIASPCTAYYEGHLGAYHQVYDACSYYPLLDCSGSEIVRVSQGNYGDLRPFVGQYVGVNTVIDQCGTGIAGQPLYGPVVTGIQTVVDACTGYYEGRLGPYHPVADGCSYYPLLDCAGQEKVQLSQGSFGDLRPYVGQYVGVTTVISECGTGIAGQPLYGPVVTQLSVLADACLQPTGTPTPTPSPTATATQTPFVVCTPPPCRPDEVYYCPGECPGGCGTGCATVTPSPTETVTATSTATGTPTSTATPTPTATAIPGHFLYLPKVIRGFP